MIGIDDKARPPYIEFEQRAVEDRDATIANDRLTYKDVDFVIVRQIGSVNTVEKEAKEWLNDHRKLADSGKMPMSWYEMFERKYKEYKEGLDPQVDGYALKLWAGISKADVQNCANLKIYSVEDLAAINDETMQRLGMGAMALKQKAQAWLDADGKGSEELAALRQQNKDLTETVERLASQLKELEAELPKKKGKKAA